MSSTEEVPEGQSSETQILRVDLKTEEEVQHWLATYEEETNTKWIVLKTFRDAQRLVKI